MILAERQDVADTLPNFTKRGRFNVQHELELGSLQSPVGARGECVEGGIDL